jgi:hypothetical protein
VAVSIFKKFATAPPTMTATIVVESVVLAVAEPPPATPTWFTWVELALAATLTVTVIGAHSWVGWNFLVS